MNEKTFKLITFRGYEFTTRANALLKAIAIVYEQKVDGTPWTKQYCLIYNMDNGWTSGIVSTDENGRVQVAIADKSLLTPQQ